MCRRGDEDCGFIAVTIDVLLAVLTTWLRLTFGLDSLREPTESNVVYVAETAILPPWLQRYPDVSSQLFDHS